MNVQNNDGILVYITYLSIKRYSGKHWLSSVLDYPTYIIFPVFTNISFYQLDEDCSEQAFVKTFVEVDNTMVQYLENLVFKIIYDLFFRMMSNQSLIQLIQTL